MPRLPRQLADASCYHVLGRGNNRTVIFHEAPDYQHYAQLLLEYFSAHGVRLHHYCLNSGDIIRNS